MDEKVAKMREIVANIPKNEATGDILSAEVAAGKLMELRRLLSPTPPLVLIKHLWDLGAIGLIIECIGGLSTNHPADRDTIKALLVVVAHSAGTGTGDQFNNIPLIPTVMRCCAAIVAAHFTPMPDLDVLPWVEQQKFEELIGFVCSLLQSLTKVAEMHSTVAGEVLRNTLLLTMLTSEEPKIARACLFLLHEASRWKGEIKTMNKDHAIELAEECCFFLIEGEAKYEAEISAKLLLTFLKSDPSVVRSLSQFGDLGKEISSKWSSSPFSELCEELVSFFKSDRRMQARHEAEIKANLAATVIQSNYKGYLLRKRMMKLRPAIRHIENLRLEQLSRRQSEFHAKKGQELAAAIARDRSRQKRIDARKSEMQLLSKLSPSKVDAFYTERLDQQRSSAARKIQSQWRKYRRQSTASAVSLEAKRQASARIIQQAYRLHRDRKNRELEKLSTAGSALPGLTEIRRQELANAIRRGQKERVPSLDGSDIDAVQKLYSGAQRQLWKIVQNRKYANAASTHRSQMIDNLRLEVKSQQDLLLRDIDTQLKSRKKLGSSHIPGVQSDAAIKHRKMLIYLRQPWWKRESNYK